MKDEAAGIIAGPVVLGSSAIVLALAAFAIWAAWAPLSGAVVATALVKTEASRKAVQHQEGGAIKALLVRDGDAVKAGQALVELESVGTDANHQLLSELTIFETIKHDRLDAEQQLAAGFRIRPELAQRPAQDLVGAAYQRELQIFQARRTGMLQQLAVLDEQLQAIGHEGVALRREVAADRTAIQLTEEELAINRSLEAQHFVSRTRVLGLQRELADYESRLGEHEAALAQTGQRSNDVRLRMASVRNEYQRQAAEEFKDSSAKLVELRERLRPVEDAMQRKVVTAPASGRIVGLRVHAAGEMVGPRDVIMEVVPDSEALILEAQVPVDGIKDLRPGQPAEIRFTAFKARTTPIVQGTLAYVSADALADRNDVPYYAVHVRPDPGSLRRSGLPALQPGMAAEVFILTEGRTALDYLLAPVTDTLRRSLRER